MPNEVIIEILRKQQGQKKKTLAAPSFRDEEIGRRRTGGIRFYDLGWILDGAEYVTFPYSDPLAGTTLTFNSDGTRNNARSNAELTLSELQTSLYDRFFEVPVADWTSTYRQITEEHTALQALNVTYNGSSYFLTTASSTWSSGVFRPTNTPGSGFTTMTWNILGRAFIKSGSSYKVTGEYDYSASEASFTMSRNCDVFLIPNIYTMSVRTEIMANPGTVIGNRDVLNDLSELAPREVFLDVTHPYYGRLGAFTENPSWQEGVSTGSTYTEMHDLMRYWQEYHPIRARRAARSGATYTDTALDVEDFAPSGEWPDPPTEPNPAGYTSYNMAFNGLIQSFSVTQRLVAVVKQEGQFYYFWNN